MSRLRRDILVNTVLAFVNTLAYMWVIREASILLVPAALGLLLLAKRFADSISNLLQLGSAQTLRRYIPMTGDPLARYAYLVANLLIFSGSSFVFLTAFAYDWSWWANVIFPSEIGAEQLTVALVLLCIATVLAFISSSTLLALGHIKAMNLLDTMNASGWLLLVLWLEGNAVTVQSLLLIQAAGTAAVSSTALIVILHSLYSAMSKRPRIDDYWHAIRETLSYGFARTLTPFLDASLILLGPWLLRADPTEAGYIIIAFTFLRLGRMLVQPAALVMGVAVAAQLGQGDPTQLRRQMNMFFGTVAYASVFVVAVILPWTLILLRIWLGNQGMTDQVAVYAAVLLMAMPPLAVAQALKEPIEMIWKRPLYLVNLLLCLMVLFAWSKWTSGAFGMVHGVLSGYVIVYWLGCLFCLYLLRGYLESPTYYVTRALAIVVLLILGANAAVFKMVEHASFGSQSAAGLIAIGTSMTFLVIWARKTRASPFIVDLRSSIRGE